MSTLLETLNKLHKLYILQEEPSEEDYAKIEKLKKDPDVAKYLENPTEEIIMSAVSFDGMSLKLFPNSQTTEICLAAVKNFGRALQFVKEQTPEICLEAVKRDPLALRFVKEQIPEICLEAVKNNPEAMRYVNIHLPEGPILVD